MLVRGEASTPKSMHPISGEAPFAKKVGFDAWAVDVVGVLSSADFALTAAECMIVTVGCIFCKKSVISECIQSGDTHSGG